MSFSHSESIILVLSILPVKMLQGIFTIFLISSKKTAEATEVIEYLTSVLRGQSEASVVVVEGYGDGCSEAKIIKKPPDEKERLKAAELLGKRYGLFTDKVDVGGAVPVVISGGEDLED